MAILASDLLAFHSGAGSNSNIANDLGGAISSAQLTDNSANNLFRDVTGDETSAGIIFYKGFYLKNNHGSLTLTSSKLWVQTQTPAGDDVSIALSAEGINATMATIANETTAPATVSFTAPASKSAGLSVGDVSSGQRYGIWVKVNVPASTSAYTSNSYVLKWEGDTVA